MIIANGAIEFKLKAPAGIDPATGYPRPAGEAGWSVPIPCQYIPVSRTLLTRTAGGERITKSSYTVLIEMQPLPESEQVRLTDAGGRCLGEFSMAAPPEMLDAVDEIKISL